MVQRLIHPLKIKTNTACIKMIGAVWKLIIFTSMVNRIVNTTRNERPVPVAARSKAYVYGRSPAAIVGSNPTRGMDVCLL